MTGLNGVGGYRNLLPAETDGLLELAVVSIGNARLSERYWSDVDKSAEFFRALGLKLFDVDEPGHPHMVDGGIGRSAAFQLF